MKQVQKRPLKCMTREKRYSIREKRLSAPMLILEDLIKVPLFKCQRCGECLLSKTAFTCSQRCPKRLRNGPCGGTREGGYCEVVPERRCVWYLIHKRAGLLRRTHMLDEIQNMHAWNYERTSAWLNVFTRRIPAPKLFLKKKKR